MRNIVQKAICVRLAVSNDLHPAVDSHVAVVFPYGFQEWQPDSHYLHSLSPLQSMQPQCDQQVWMGSSVDPVDNSTVFTHLRNLYLQGAVLKKYTFIT